MTKTELEQILLRLDLSQTEAAQLLSVAPRTVRRWLEGEDIPGPAEQAFRAWLRLHERGLAWRPDSVSIAAGDQDQVDRHREHTVSISDMVARVEARGGPRLPWTVDRERSCATYGPMAVSFYNLASGSFSLGTYTRKDSDPDVGRDWELIEDAAYSIAQAMAERPVTLVYHNRPWRSGTVTPTLKKFSSTEEAIQFAYGKQGVADFHDAFIMAGNPPEPIMDKHQLRLEYEGRATLVKALLAVANYVRAHSSLSARSGPQLLSPAQAEQKKRKIESLSDQLVELAGLAERGSATYQKFDLVLGELHKLGFFPETSLVSAVARAFRK
jgi:Helix-turn-helix